MAITAGSRGIADIPLVIRTVADVVREAGAEPFVVPAMGSHGGATAEGQRHVLAEYGITEDSRRRADSRHHGHRRAGPAAQRRAWSTSTPTPPRADATIVVNRVKAHTAFRGEIESGLCKMTAIGLGKQPGAEQIHALRPARPHSAGRQPVAASTTTSSPAWRWSKTPPTSWPSSAPRRPTAFSTPTASCCKPANAYLPRIPFDHLHLLVVGWLGKNLSGSGMDYNVVGMWRRIGGEHVPDFERIAVLDLTAESDGNGLGVGIADFTTRRLYRQVGPATRCT